jgi:hypothetical protein
LNCQYLTSVIIYSPTIEIERDAFLFTSSLEGKKVNICLKKSTFEKLNGENYLPEKRQVIFMSEDF